MVHKRATKTVALLTCLAFTLTPVAGALEVGSDLKTGEGMPNPETQCSLASVDSQRNSRCPIGWVPYTYYNYDCVKKIAPGWAETACGQAGSPPAVALCLVTTAQLKAAHCAAFSCVPASPGIQSLPPESE